MSLVITSHPVTTVEGQKRNVFAGFAPIEVVFKREDFNINKITEQSGNILIEPLGIPVPLPSIGDSVYVYSEGATYTYDAVGTVLTDGILDPNRKFEVDITYIESTEGGWVNNRKNYYVEVQLVDTLGIDILKFNLRSDGKNNGVINIDIGLPNDKNSFAIPLDSGEITSGRIKYKFKYKEVYDNSTAGFVSDSEEIIAVYATEQMDIEDIVSSFDEPRLYIGYPFFVNFFHSDANQTGAVPVIRYSELDINQTPIVSGTKLKAFGENDYGLLVAIFEETVLDDDTKYIKFDAAFETPAFFDIAFFDPTFFDA